MEIIIGHSPLGSGPSAAHVLRHRARRGHDVRPRGQDDPLLGQPGDRGPLLRFFDENHRFFNRGPTQIGFSSEN